ncbi:MAG: insulinase family protein [Candidatus Aminicenantales bacterium]
MLPLTEPRKTFGLWRVLLILIFVFFSPSVGQTPPPQKEDAISLDQKLAIDPALIHEQLDNGFRYFIRKNLRPENRADLRLVVNAGSVLEDDDQLGLAHFVEHMAFNGTRHFAKQELVHFMESIGMRFGPELNAFTSFDETIYILEVPTEKLEIMKTAFQILEDWAHGLSFDPVEIDKERGVIIEEWRLRRGANARMQDKQFPILFQGSRYALRLPIGEMKIIESFGHETLKRFYRDWYRPDLMALIAVGDFDPPTVEKLIREHFSLLPPPADPRPRILYEVPEHAETLFAIAQDKEATGTSVAVYNKLPLRDQSTAGAYRQVLVEQLYNAMLNQRFYEITQKPDAPFIRAFSGRGQFIRSKEIYSLGAMVKEEGIERGLEALFMESERVTRFGFTQSELDRQKLDLLRSIERMATEKEKQESSSYVEEYTRHFLQGEPTPGIEREFQLVQQFLPGITLEEVNRLGREWMTTKNRVVLVSAPEKEGFTVPTEKRLLEVLNRTSSMEITPYKDTAAEKPLLPAVPEPGKIIKSSALEEMNITEWDLSNGIKVILKPTDFKADEILLRAFSPGGTSLAKDEDYIASATAGLIVPAGGLGDFNAVDLKKALSGKVASVRPFITEIEEGLAGSASPKDLETLFQLIYLSFTAPRCDPTIFNVMTTQINAMLANRAASPDVAFMDTLQTTLSQNHYRTRPMTAEIITEMNLDKSCAFYKDRFAEAGDFTFLFIGNLDLEAMRPLVERYLGSLPSLNRKETWRNVGINPPSGVVQKEVHKGMEPKSQTAIVFGGSFEYDQAHRTSIRALGLILESKLREIVREELSGTYGVMVRPSYSKIPDEEFSLMINFGCDPARVDELVKAVFQEFENLKDKGPSDKDVSDAREGLFREYETGRKQNNWLLNQIAAKYQLQEDPRHLLALEKSFQALSSQMIQEAARTYLNTDNYVRVTLYPEKEKEKNSLP